MNSFMGLGVFFLLIVALFVVAGVAGVISSILDKRARTVKKRQQELADAINALEEEFPEEFKSFGGNEVMHNPRIVRGLLLQMSEAEGSVELDSPARIRLLASMLTTHAEQLQIVENRESVPAIRIFLVAQVAGWFMGFFTATCFGSKRYPSYSLLGWPFDTQLFNCSVGAGAATFLAVIFAQMLVWKWRLSQAMAAAEMSERNIVEEFPEVIASLGGESAISDQAVVRRFAHELSARPDALLAGERRDSVAILLNRLTALLEERTTAKMPLIRMLVIALPIGYIFGHLFGETIYSNIHPSRGFFNVFSNVRLEMSAVIGGIIMGLAWAAGLVGAQMAIWNWHMRRLDERADDMRSALEGRFSKEVRSWGGPAILRDAKTVAELTRNFSTQVTRS